MLSVRYKPITGSFDFGINLNHKLYINKNRFRFNKTLNKFGQLQQIKYFNSRRKPSFSISATANIKTVLFVTVTHPTRATITILTTYADLWKKLSIYQNAYFIITSTVDYSVIISEYLGDYNVIVGLYLYNIPHRLFDMSKKIILLGPYIGLGEIIHYKHTNLYQRVNIVNRRRMPYVYYLNEYNTTISAHSVIPFYYKVLFYLLADTPISYVKQNDKIMLQALRWPLGKPSLIFFTLWKLTGDINFETKINLKFLIALFKKITRKEITSQFGLGDLFIATIGVIRKHVNKILPIKCYTEAKHLTNYVQLLNYRLNYFKPGVGIETPCKYMQALPFLTSSASINTLTFKNIWKEIAVIQIMRYEKLIYKQVNREEPSLAENLDSNYVYLPINPWMVDISAEIKNNEIVRANLLDKNKWPQDWPPLTTK